MTKFFVRKGCEDPDELFGETRDRVIKIINAGSDYPNPDALFYGVARNVWKEDWRRLRFEPLEIDPPATDPDDQELVADCLDICLAKLPETERDLITRFYQGSGRNKIETRKQLAAEHGGRNTLGLKAFRIRAKLRRWMDDCLGRGEN